MQPFMPPVVNPETHLARVVPDHPVLFFSPAKLQETAKAFLQGFPGMVTYAVKANPHPLVLSNLVAAGITGFDVASPAEMEAARGACASAVLHYNNPVRSAAEIEAGIAYGVASWSVDEMSELEKLANVPTDNEIAVRFAMPVDSAVYNFGEKFGATPEDAVKLLKRVAQMGHTPSLYFHPGTQCADPIAWEIYIHAAKAIVDEAGVKIARLNVGGGFAANRDGTDHDATAIFSMIRNTVEEMFGEDAPELLCEPGRAMVAESCTLATRIKSLRGEDGKVVYMNDGVYGGLMDIRDMGLTGSVRVIDASGKARTGMPLPRIIFGPTCDSLDRLPDGQLLPSDSAVGDYILFPGLGAYSSSMSTIFNGYGLQDMICVDRLSN